MTRSRWWHWLLGTYLIITIWVLLSPIFSTGSRMLFGESGAWQQLVAELVAFVPFFVATPLIWRYFLKRDIVLLINSSGHIDRRRIITGFGVWFAISVLSSGIDYVINTSDYRWSFSVSVFFPYALAAILLLPLQTTAEELFFRGWILQWARALATPAKVVLGGIVFAVPHLANPEAAGNPLPALAAWFILGAGWSYASIRDGGIELAIGAHFANNLFALTVVGYDGAALPTSALLTTSQLNMEATAIALVIAMAIFIALTRRK